MQVEKNVGMYALLKSTKQCSWEGSVPVLLVGVMNYTAEIDTQISITIGSDIQKQLRLLLQEFYRLKYWYYWWGSFMRHANELASGGIIYLPSLMGIRSSVRVLVLRLLPLQYERLKCWYTCAVEMTLGVMIYMSIFMKFASTIQVILMFLPQQFDRFQSWCFF
jgi:hypothetical protein